MDNGAAVELVTSNQMDIHVCMGTSDLDGFPSRSFALVMKYKCVVHETSPHAPPSLLPALSPATNTTNVVDATDPMRVFSFF